MRNYVRKSCFLKDRILPFLLILSVVFLSMVSMFSVNNVYAAAGTAEAGETFYIDTSKNTNWNVSSGSAYHLYASFEQGKTIKANVVCNNVSGNIYSVTTPSSAQGADKINLFVATQGREFPATTSDSTHTRVYFQNTAGWSKVYAYVWTGNSNYKAAFPGEEMTPVSTGSSYYYYDIDNKYDNIIFSNGTNTTQTKDLVIPSTNNSLYVWNTSNTSLTKWSTTPYIRYDATVDLTNRETDANHIMILSGNTAHLSRYKYNWSPSDSNIAMVTIYLYNLSWYSSTGAAPYVTYDYNDDFLRNTVQMTAVSGEPGFYTVKVPVGSKIVFRRTQNTNSQVSAQTNVPANYTEPCYVMGTSSADHWREKSAALESYYDYFVEDNFNKNSNILGVEATYFDYLSDEELSKGWLNPIKAGTDGTDKDGATDDWFPFDNFNNKISSVASANSSLWKYPLYFGNFCNTSDAYNFSNHGGPYSSAIAGLTNFNYYVNNSNGLIDQNGKSGTTESFSASLHGLASNSLDENGNIQYADGHKMPYFDSEWLNETKVNGKSIGKTVKSYFPFEAVTLNKGQSNEVTTYTFNSASSTDTRKDNVYFTWKNGVPETVNYGSGINYSIKDGKKNFLGVDSGYGLFPFNNTSSENAHNPGNGNLDYGFGVRLDIDFRVPVNGILTNNQPVKFDFKGDDDLWVYITDPETNKSQLVLDLGGVHSQTEGSIDFKNMKATDYDVNEIANSAVDISDRMYITDSYSWGHIYVWAWDDSGNGDWYQAQYDSSCGKYYVYKSQRGSNGRLLSTKTKFLLASDDKYNNQTSNFDLAGHFGKNTYTDNPSYTDSVGGASPLKYYASTTKNFGFESNGDGTYKQLDPDKTYHMTVFYMERGMIESNFYVEFTMTPANTDVKVNKEIVADSVNPGLSTAVRKLNSAFDFVPYENGKTVSGNDTLAYSINDSNIKQTVSASNPKFQLKNGDTADFEKEFTLGSTVKFTEQENTGIQYDTTWKVWDVKNDVSKGSGTGKTNTAFTLRNGNDEHDDADFLVNFVNKPQTADVSLSKLVQDETGKVLDSDEISDTFGFYVTVDLEGNGIYRPYPLSYEIVYGDGSGSDVLNTRSTDGYLTFTTGDKVTLKDIPVGAKLQIREATKAGYLPVSCEVTGSSSILNNFAANRTVQVGVASGSNSLVFTNKQNTSSAALSAKKLLDGEAYTGSLFSFELKGLPSTTYTDSDTDVTTKDLSDQSLTVDSVSGGDITFRGNTSNKILNFAEAGVYRYKMYEKPLTANPDDIYTVDSKVYLAEITVTENGASLVPGTPVYYKTPDTVNSSTTDDVLQQYFTADNRLDSSAPVPEFNNTTRKGKVTVNKTDQYSNTLSDVEFAIYKVSGDGISPESGQEPFMRESTNEEGQIVFENLPIFKDGYQSSGETPEYQWYCLAELSPKDGYSINKEVKYFTLPWEGTFEPTFSYVNGAVIMPDASGSGMNGFIVAGAWILALGAILAIGYFFFIGSKSKRRTK